MKDATGFDLRSMSNRGLLLLQERVMVEVNHDNQRASEYAQLGFSNLARHCRKNKLAGEHLLLAISKAYKTKVITP